MSEPIRVVVGEGPGAGNPGLLRSALERDGHRVLAEASSSVDLARVLTEQQPDVVVLDDAIGVGAIQLVRDLCPDAKVVLVWPSAVVPVGADARVEPQQVLGGLSAAVSRVAGASLPAVLQPPEWVEKVRKDPSTLREMLATHGGAEAARPSVTELQRHIVAPLVLVPGGDEASGSADLPAPPAAAAARNRRIGSIALGGAVAVGAASIALALGGARIPIEILRPAAIVIPQPISSGPAISWPPDDANTGSGGNGGNGGPETGGNGGNGGPETGGNGGNGTAPPPVYPPTDPGVDQGGNGGGGGDGTHGGGGDGAGQPPGGGGGQPPKDGGGGGPTGVCIEESAPYAGIDSDDVCDDWMPGKSELHNPHGGPPGQTHEAPTDGHGDPSPGRGNA